MSGRVRLLERINLGTCWKEGVSVCSELWRDRGGDTADCAQCGPRFEHLDRGIYRSGAFPLAVSPSVGFATRNMSLCVVFGTTVKKALGISICR